MFSREFKTGSVYYIVFPTSVPEIDNPIQTRWVITSARVIGQQKSMILIEYCDDERPIRQQWTLRPWNAFPSPREAIDDYKKHLLDRRDSERKRGRKIAARINGRIREIGEKIRSLEKFENDHENLH